MGVILEFMSHEGCIEFEIAVFSVRMCECKFQRHAGCGLSPIKCRQYDLIVITENES